MKAYFLEVSPSLGYQGIVKATVFYRLQDLEFKLSEGSDQNCFWQQGRSADLISSRIPFRKKQTTTEFFRNSGQFPTVLNPAAPSNNEAAAQKQQH